MKHKALQLMGISILSATLLIGCGSSNTTAGDTNSNTTETAAANEETSSVYGQITAIEGSTLTVALGTKKQMNDHREDAFPTGKPERPDEDSAPTGMPEGDTSSNDAKKEKGERPSMLDLTGESKTIAIADSTTITVKSGQSSTTGTVDDLKVGSTISFELADDDKTATTINVRTGGSNKGNKPN